MSQGGNRVTFTDPVPDPDPVLSALGRPGLDPVTRPGLTR